MFWTCWLKLGLLVSLPKPELQPLDLDIGSNLVERMGWGGKENCAFIWTDIRPGDGMGGEEEEVRVLEDEETQAQNKIPLVPVSLACPSAEPLRNLGAEVGDRDGVG